jgi:hypothetical protein
MQLGFQRDGLRRARNTFFVYKGFRFFEQQTSTETLEQFVKQRPALFVALFISILFLSSFSLFLSFFLFVPTSSLF